MSLKLILFTKVTYQDSAYLTYDWVLGDNIECLKSIVVDSIVKKLGDNYHFSKTKGKGKYSIYRYKYGQDEELKHEYNLVLQKYFQGIVNEAVWSSTQGSKMVVTHFELRLITF